MKKLFFVVIILVIAAFGIGAGSGLAGHFKPALPTPNPQVLPAKDSQETVTSTETKTEEVSVESFAIPQTIEIPKIHVKAAIESVGQDSNKGMDVPKNSDNAAWYNLGFKPGQQGSAVIAGHYDKKDGSPAVFWDLAKLVVGDKIIVTDEQGKSLTFEVTRSEKFPYDQFPLQEVFGPSSDKMLNIITCEGKWNGETGMYSHRSVIFSRLVE